MDVSNIMHCLLAFFFFFYIPGARVESFEIIKCNLKHYQLYRVNRSLFTTLLSDYYFH